MDTVSIAGAAMLAKTAQTQQAMSISIMKKAADQQNRMATCWPGTPNRHSRQPRIAGTAFRPMPEQIHH